MNRRIAFTAVALFLMALTSNRIVAQKTAVLSANPANVAVKELPTASPEDVGMSSAKLAAVDQIMQGYVDDGKMVGGIVMIARKGKICFFEDYGLADREKGQAMRKDSILRFYSMTKAITTVSALMLHDEGKLDVNAPVGKYLPELSQMQVVAKDGKDGVARKQMTVADLMRHTSGLCYGWSDDVKPLFEKHDPTSRDIKLSEMPGRLKNIPLRFEPGSAWEYGVSTDVLGRVVEVVSGQTLDEFMRGRLFGPLDMKDTGFYVPEEKQSRFAGCYKLKDGELNAAMSEKDDEDEYRKYASPPKFLSGGGGLVSTARDYMRFLMMIERGGVLEGRRYLKPETVALMTTNQTSKEAGWVRFGDEVREGVGFGFGFCVRDKMSDWDPGGRVGEYGWGGAASTHYWVSPKDELIVITLEQVRPYRWLTEFGVKKQIYDAIVE